MSLGGLIAGALGGAAKGYTQYAESELKKQQELDLRKMLAEVEIEKDQRIKEADLMRARTEETRKLSPEYLEQVGKADLTKGQIAARNRTTLAPDTAAADVAEGTAKAGTRTTLAPVNAAADTAEYDARKPLEERKATDKVKLETKLTVDQVNTPGYLDAVAKKAKAGNVESAGSLAQAALANFKLGRERQVGALQDRLANTDDPALREKLTQQIRDLSGGSSTRSFADVVAMGNGYVNMAAKLRAQAKDAMDADSAALLNAQATQYEQAADAVFRSVSEKRLGPGAAAPKPAAGGAAKPATGNLDLNQFFTK